MVASRPIMTPFDAEATITFLTSRAEIKVGTLKGIVLSSDTAISDLICLSVRWMIAHPIDIRSEFKIDITNDQYAENEGPTDHEFTGYLTDLLEKS
jgi:hypothetical protein